MHRLISAAGSANEPTTYSLPGGERLQARATIPATLRVLARAGQPVDEVLLFASPTALASCKPWIAEVHPAGTRVTPVELDEHELGDPWRLVQRLLGRDDWPNVSRLSVDATHGPRTVPLVLFLGAFLLSTLEPSLQLGSVFVGSLLRGFEEHPLYQLDDLVTLARWGQSLEAAFGGGPLRLVGELTRKAVGDLFRQGHQSLPAGRLRNDLEQFAAALAMVQVPAVRALAPRLAAPRFGDAAPEHPILAPLGDALARRVLESGLSAGDDSATDQLARELALARLYHGWRDPLRASIVLREWCVNRVLAARGVPPGQWGRRAEREALEHALHRAVPRPTAAGHPSADTSADPAVVAIGRLWNEVTMFRNAVSHAGFSEEAKQKTGAQVLDQALQTVGQLIERAKAQLVPVGQDGDPWRLDQPLASDLVITPLGQTLEVLDTLLGQLTPLPQRLLVVTATALAPEIQARLAQLGFPGDWQVIALDDPHRPTPQSKQAQRQLLDAATSVGSLTCNLTGGTTYLQTMVADAAAQARDAGAEVTRVLLIPDGAGRYALCEL
jgi:hypothetical protein